MARANLVGFCFFFLNTDSLCGLARFVYRLGLLINTLNWSEKTRQSKLICICEKWLWLDNGYIYMAWGKDDGRGMPLIYLPLFVASSLRDLVRDKSMWIASVRWNVHSTVYFPIKTILFKDQVMGDKANNQLELKHRDRRHTEFNLDISHVFYRTSSWGFN